MRAVLTFSSEQKHKLKSKYYASKVDLEAQREHVWNDEDLSGEMPYRYTYMRKNIVQSCSRQSLRSDSAYFGLGFNGWKMVVYFLELPHR